MLPCYQECNTKSRIGQEQKKTNSIIPFFWILESETYQYLVREQQSAQEDFRTDYFLVLVDMAISQLKSRFEQMTHFDSIFGFLFDASRFIYLDDKELKNCCENLVISLRHGKLSDIDAEDLVSELQVLQVMLPSQAYETRTLWTSLEIMEFAKDRDGYVSNCIGCLQDFINYTCYCDIC